jgi:hypothetical protein
VIGFQAYAILRRSEQNLADSVYDSVSVAALTNTQVSFGRAVVSTIVVAAAYSTENPLESKWPNATLSGYRQTIGQIANMSSINEVTFSPVLRPDQVPAYEAFAFNMWDLDPLIPPGRANVSGQRGIWNFDRSIPFPGSIHLDDLSGNTSWAAKGSDSQYMVPLTQTINPAVLGLNTFPDPLIGPFVLEVILCARSRPTVESALSDCSTVLTPLILPLPSPLEPSPTEFTGYQTIIQTPVAIVGDDGKTKCVAVIAGAIDWVDLLLDTVPSFSGEMDVVVESEAVLGNPPVAFTFTFEKGLLYVFLCLSPMPYTSISINVFYCCSHSRSKKDSPFSKVLVIYTIVSIVTKRYVYRRC